MDALGLDICEDFTRFIFISLAMDILNHEAALEFALIQLLHVFKSVKLEKVLMAGLCEWG